MGKIITKEISNKLKLLIESGDPVNYELALIILKGIPELSKHHAEQKICQLLLKKVKYRFLLPKGWIKKNIKNKNLLKQYG